MYSSKPRTLFAPRRRPRPVKLALTAGGVARLPLGGPTSPCGRPAPGMGSGDRRGWEVAKTAWQITAVVNEDCGQAQLPPARPAGNAAVAAPPPQGVRRAERPLDTSHVRGRAASARGDAKPRDRLHSAGERCLDGVHAAAIDDLPQGVAPGGPVPVAGAIERVVERAGLRIGAHRPYDPSVADRDVEDLRVQADTVSLVGLRPDDATADDVSCDLGGCAADPLNPLVKAVANRLEGSFGGRMRRHGAFG